MTARKTFPSCIIAIEDAGQFRKVLRIVTTQDGSFGLVPLHPASVGILSKSGPPPILSAPGGGWTEMLETHLVGTKVKLIYHPSGFVQFSKASSKKVRSGEKSRTEFYLPEGMGIHSQPFSDPIETGPSVTAVFHNVHECPLVNRSEPVPVIAFREEDILDWFHHSPFGFLDMLVGPTTHHVYSVEVFIFPPEVRREAVYADGRWVLIRAYSTERADLDDTRFRVFDLPTPIASLGILVKRYHEKNDQTRPPTGYSLGGPRDLGSGYWVGGQWPGPADDRDMPWLDVEPTAEVAASRAEVQDAEIGGELPLSDS